MTPTDALEKPRVTRYAETLLPTEHGELRFVVYRTPAGVEHVAAVAGEVTGEAPVLCRVHSECLTSEVFGSLKCDCKAQLDRALELIARQGRGVVLYLRQEGRGIGLGNKIRAYALQEHGHDTVDANRLLGLPDDARDYGEAVAMLEDLGVRRVELLTNNPLKIEGLEKAGIEVVRRRAHLVEMPTPALSYVTTKQVRMGHLLADEDATALTDAELEADALAADELEAGALEADALEAGTLDDEAASGEPRRLPQKAPVDLLSRKIALSG